MSELSVLRVPDCDKAFVQRVQRRHGLGAELPPKDIRVAGYAGLTLALWQRDKTMLQRPTDEHLGLTATQPRGDATQLGGRAAKLLATR